ncbi:NAD(P)-dependent oxidoreductase [Pseudorhodoferax sp.]|uniref:NAD(P)-dependent oxidoreductase n=1 Tax=Pseudorhodoferax sp. TaxID=1993553 RepID=UPI002DD683B9|nr:NAD(P)-dependent oxidoreductase [Pseudorhodoferax sp.]
MSKVAVLGITGNAGSRIANELLARGHSVTGIARDPSKAPARAGLRLVAADATQAATLAPLLQGHDVVVSATRFVGGIDAATLVAAARQAGVPRIAVVGGAGSLEVAPGVALIDTPQFPEAYKAEAGAGRVFLQALRDVQGLDWTFLSPSALFAPGERTGQFRLGGDQLLVDAQGNSHVSMEDFAVALVDEIEQPRHPRQRFTVGY